jgi:hypothetical protein
MCSLDWIAAALAQGGASATAVSNAVAQAYSQVGVGCWLETKVALGVHLCCHQHCPELAQSLDKVLMGIVH